MDIDFAKIGELAVDELTATATELLSQTNDDQKSRVLDATRKLAQEGAKAIADPANAAKHRRNVEFLVGMLENEAALASIRAAHAAQEAAKRTLIRVAQMVLGAVL